MKKILLLLFLCLTLCACDGVFTSSTFITTDFMGETTTFVDNANITGNSNITVTTAVVDNNLYVSPKGKSSNTGSFDSPLDFSSAIEQVLPGRTIVLLSGKYEFDDEIIIPSGNDGTINKRKKITTLNNEIVTFDFSDESYSSSDLNSNASGLIINGSYWEICNIRIEKAASRGFLVTGNYNILNNCIAYANKDSGFQLARREESQTDIEDWPNNNKIINCISYDNGDSVVDRANGFAVKLTVGENNILDGCVAYRNINNGFDLETRATYGNIGAVVIKNSIAYCNGMNTKNEISSNSNGNGFKLGYSSGNISHIVYNCISYSNKGHGFTDGGNDGIITFENCTSYNNGMNTSSKSNFHSNNRTANHKFINCVSFLEHSMDSDKFYGTAENCLFYNSKEWYYVGDEQKVCSSDSSKRGEKIKDEITADLLFKCYVLENYNPLLIKGTNFLEINFEAITNIYNGL